MPRLYLPAYAKINLTLDVGELRPDGYHQISSVMQTVAICDTLVFSGTEGIHVYCDQPGVPSGSDNLVAQALGQIEGSLPAGLRVEITKRIPVAAGMGGGSSDAATALKGANSYYRLGLSREQLVDISARVGSDVPFFIYGGTILAQGRGERLTPLPALPTLWMLVVKPPISVSTGQVYTDYRSLSAEQQTPKLLAALGSGDRQQLLAALGNDLEQVTSKLHPEIAIIKERMLVLGAGRSLMSGSGPTVFGVFPDETAAWQAARGYPVRDEQIYVCQTISAGEMGKERWGK